MADASLPPIHVPRPQRLLVLVAHPGDGERSLAGSVWRWTAEGTEAWLICGTSGDARGDDARADALELAARGEREQREAASIVGYRDVTFLHRPEGALVNDLALREQLVRLIRSHRPDCVATADPRPLFHPDGRINHIDRRELGAATIDALPAAERAMAFPQLARTEGLEPWAVRRILLFDSDQPTHVLDTREALPAKERALRAHSVHEQPAASEPLQPLESFVLIERS